MCTVACSDGDHVQCHFGGGGLVVSHAHRRFDDLGLDAVGDQGVAYWSDPTGLFLRPLTDEGEGEGAARRLGPPCPGGIASATRSDTLWLACLRHGRSAQDKAGHVVLLEMSVDGDIRARTTFGQVGPESRGVSVAIGDDGPVVAWHDGSPMAWVVWRTLVDGEQEFEPRMLSSERTAAGAPFVLESEGRVLTVWPELWSGPDGVTGQLVLHGRTPVPRQVMEVDFARPTPRLAQDEHGLILAFRDRRRPFRKTGLFMQRLSSELMPIGDARRVGRANSDGPPTVVPTAGQVWAIAPRTWGRSEILVGVNVMGADLDALAHEQQVYEYGANFTAGAALWRGDHLLVATAERGTSTRREARIRTITLACH